MRKSTLLLTFLVIGFTQLWGQSFYAVRRDRTLMVVGGTGTSTYFGELANRGDYFDAKPSLTGGLQFFVNNHISLRAEAVWFTLAGSDATAGNPDRVPRNLSFKSSNFELNATGALSFFPNGNRYYRRPAFNLYGFAGIGVMYFNPTTVYNGQKYALQPLKTELVSYNRIGLVIPFGLGVRLKLNPNFNLALEGGLRKVFTDYIDDVSTVHNDASKFTDPIAIALSDRRPEIGLPPAADGDIRGNPTKDDGYFLLNAKVEYYLPMSFNSGNNKNMTKKKRNAYYRYNKRGGMKKQKRRR